VNILIVDDQQSARTMMRHVVEDPTHAIEFCFQQGWTDGLPVVPPTEPAVCAMLEAAGLEPDKEVCFITNRQVAVSAEKVAVNAVMAGCLPEHMPIVLAAIEAIADPKWGYHGPAASTGGAAPLMIVNGPIAKGFGWFYFVVITAAALAAIPLFLLTAGGNG